MGRCGHPLYFQLYIKKTEGWIKKGEDKKHCLLSSLFYHEMKTGVKYEVPIAAKNVFVKLVKNIIKGNYLILPIVVCN